MKDDIRKAELDWAQRRLFSPRPHRRGRWLLLVLLSLLGLFALFYQIGSGVPLTSM